MAKKIEKSLFILTNGLGSTGDGTPRFCLSKTDADRLFAEAGWEKYSPHTCTPKGALQIANAAYYGTGRSADEGQSIAWKIAKEHPDFPREIILSVTCVETHGNVSDVDSEVTFAVSVNKDNSTITMHPENKEIRSMIQTWLQSCDTGKVRAALDRILVEEMDGVKFGSNGKLGWMVDTKYSDEVARMERLVESFGFNSRCEVYEFSRESERNRGMIRATIDRAAREKLRALVLNINATAKQIAEEKKAIKSGATRKDGKAKNFRRREGEIAIMTEKLQSIAKLIKSESKIMHEDKSGLDSLENLIERATVNVAKLDARETVKDKISELF